MLDNDIGWGGGSIRAFHPGPDADFSPVDPHAGETKAETLSRLEREMVDAAIDRHWGGTGQLAHLAHRITILRAELA